MKTLVTTCMIFASPLINAQPEKFILNLFSEVRIEEKDPNLPEGIKVEYKYKLEGAYSLENKLEILVIDGIAQTQTFHNSETVHPAPGKPYYLVVMNEGKMRGSVIKFYEGEGSGFYLIQGLEVNDKGLLKKDSNEIILSPLTSKPFVDFFQSILANIITNSRENEPDQGK
jgi:hypothetical protein